MKLLKICLSLLSLNLLTVACEREETILVDDGREFCQVNFRYRENTVSSGCAPVPFTQHEPKFSRTATGLVLRQTLYDRNTPYFSWVDSLERYRAYNLLEPGCKVHFEFAPENMDKGTQVALFLGRTVAFPIGLPLESGDLYNPENYYAQVFMRRQMDGAYVFGSVVNGTEEIAHKSTEVAAAILEMEMDANGNLLLSSGYQNNGTALVKTRQQNALNGQNLFATAAFAGVSLFAIAEVQAACVSTQADIRLIKYFFSNTQSPQKNREDNFSCNSIWH